MMERFADSKTGGAGLNRQLAFPQIGASRDQLPQTIAERTRRIYDRVAAVYPVSTFFFHSHAHRCAVDISGIHDRMRVLEIATGSGEMFRRLVRVNRNGSTVGIDLSPNMAARAQRRAQREFPSSFARCQAVDARYLPFCDESFDAVVCCYMLELLSSSDILTALEEMRRVLRSRGRLTLVLIGENTELFNHAYRLAGSVAPAFWGRQVEHGLPELIESLDFRILRDRSVRQLFYPSRVLVAGK